MASVFTVTNNDHQCTYLNSGLPVAPREYVLYGLNPGMYWTHLWPLLAGMHLVAMPNPVYNCLWQWFKFHPNIFCYQGGFLQVNIITAIYDTGHTLIYCTSHYYCYSCSSLHFFHSSGQASCPPFPLSVTIFFHLLAALYSTSLF